MSQTIDRSYKGYALGKIILGIGPSIKETILYHFRHPLLGIASKISDIDLFGIILVETSQLNEEKNFIGKRAANLIDDFSVKVGLDED